MGAVEAPGRDARSVDLRPDPENSLRFEGRDLLCAFGDLDARVSVLAATVHANGLWSLVGRRLCRTPNWLHFPDVAIVLLCSTVRQVIPCCTWTGDAD